MERRGKKWGPKDPAFKGPDGKYILRRPLTWDRLASVMKITSFPIALAAVALAVQMSGRIVTPNGDGINDTVTFNVPMSDSSSIPRAQVYDVRGRRVADLSPVSATQLRWDGRDASGRVVGSGVYLVQISQDAALWSGVVAVAK